MLSAVMEDYLKAVYVLQREEEPPIATSAIADYMEVTPPTVSSMVEKLEERGLIEREKYKGVELTDEGETVALEVIRHHRLIEAYLAEHLDYDWSEVHEEADRLEHHISEEFERRVAEALGDPEVDPHGAPIPGADLAPPERPPGTRLDETEEGDVVVVDRVPEDDEAVLRYMRDAGVTPGRRVTVEEVAPFGMITVRPADREETVSFPADTARAVRVTPVEDADGDEEGRRPVEEEA